MTESIPLRSMSNEEDASDSNSEDVGGDKIKCLNLKSPADIIYQYVLTTSTNNIEYIYKQLEVKWGKPGLVISISGGAKKMGNFNEDQKDDFKIALSNLAKHANTWIVTAGFNTGVMELTGSVAKRHLILHPDSKNFKLIGIVTYDKIKKGTERFDVESGNIGESITGTNLDPYHDLFIFYNDPKDKSHESQIKFRAPFEIRVSEKAQCPVVQVIIDGGTGTIQSAAEALGKKIPIVVIKGSKRAADQICQVVENEDVNINGITTNEKEIESLKKIKEFKDKVRTLQISKIAEELDLEIMKAAFIDKNDYEKLLDLQMSYNRFDVASEKITELLDHKDSIPRVVQRAWNENLYEFMYLFHKNGINIFNHLSEICEDKYLTLKEKEYIYLLENRKDLDKVKRCFKRLSKGIYSINEKRDDETKKKVLHQELFILCFILQRFEMAKVIWSSTHEDSINLALLGCVVCKSLAEIAKIEGEEKTRIEFQKQKEDYLEKACCVLTEAYLQDKDRTLSLVIKPIVGNRTETAMDIADQHYLMSFLNHEACQSKLNSIWYGKISPINSTRWLVASLLLFPLILWKISFKMEKSDDSDKMKPKILSKTDGNTADASEEYKVEIKEYKKPKMYSKTDGNSADASKECKVEIKEYKPCVKLNYFFTTPVTGFMMSLISYIVFLILYTYVCLVELGPANVVKVKHRLGEIFVYIYLISLIAEEFRQCFVDYRANPIVMIQKWFKSYWNKFDLFIFIEFFIAAVIRHISSLDFVYARTMFCLSLSLFYIRFMQFYLPVKTLGPKVIMISQMMKDVVFFIAIYVIAVFAYGTFAQGLLFSNYPLSWSLLKAIVYNPYWQTYGELQLEFVEGDEKLNNIAPTPNAMVIVAFALFMLCSNILLLNLLIAMFGNTFSKIESVSHDIWAFNRYQLIKEYYERPITPPPFNIFEMIIQLIRQRIKGKHSQRSDFLLDDQEKNLEEFQMECLKIYLRRSPITYSGSDAYIRKAITERREE